MICFKSKLLYFLLCLDLSLLNLKLILKLLPFLEVDIQNYLIVRIVFARRPKPERNQSWQGSNFRCSPTKNWQYLNIGFRVGFLVFTWFIQYFLFKLFLCFLLCNVFCLKYQRGSERQMKSQTTSYGNPKNKNKTEHNTEDYT